ncbi:hypothetical protein GmHk_10G028241 [Glycine max]|nr:hypothetical protein GmHk_10G028241 [Glycine max]
MATELRQQTVEVSTLVTPVAHDNLPMATPPSSPPPYPPPPPIVASQLPSTLNWTQKATRLRSLATRAPGADKPMVHIDLTIGKANGPHNKKLRTYLGIVARDKVDVTYETWKQVTAAQKDLIWENIRDVQKKAQAIHKQNTAPHVLSRGGYEYLEQKLMAEKIKKKLEEAAQSGCTEVVIDPPSRIRRHVKWKMVRTKKTGKMTSEVTKEIAEKIVVVSLAKPADRPDPESLQVMWDTSLFGLFNLDFPLYIKHEDLSEIAHGGQCLSISVIQLWIMHLTETSMCAGNSYVYGFLEPQSIQRSGQSQFESESYMKSWMQNSKRDVCLGAYLNGPDNYLKGIINSALKGLDDTPQPKSKVGARWIVVKYFNDVRPLEVERLKALRI